MSTDAPIKNLFDSFQAALPADRSKALMVLPGARAVTYQEMMNKGTDIARKILAAGAKPGDRVMMQVEKTPEAIALYLGCLKVGVIFIPLNTAYGMDELTYLAGDAQPSVVVCDPSSSFTDENFPFATPCTVLTLDKSGQGSLLEDIADGDVPTSDRGGDDIAAILYTSGTTGKPKGAMLTHENLRSNAAALVECWRITGDDVLLHALPIFHTHGLFVAVNSTILSGGSMIFMSKFDIDQVFENLPTATTMMGVPTFYTRMLADPRLTKDACAHIRLFVSGSAPLLAETFAEFQSRTGHTILERYGMTETNMIASNPLVGERRGGSVGHSLPGVSVRITNEQGEALPQGEVGGIELTGPNVFKGYWQNPEKTKAEFRSDGYFITGDVGRIDEDGYLSIVGRSKDLIISGGFNIYPKEIEEVIDNMDGVIESAVVGVPHRDFGEGVLAVVVASDVSVTDEMIKKGCRSQLAAFKSPKRAILVEALPRNAMGKVEKAKLRETYRETFAN